MARRVAKVAWVGWVAYLRKAIVVLFCLLACLLDKSEGFGVLDAWILDLRSIAKDPLEILVMVIDAAISDPSRCHIGKLHKRQSREREKRRREGDEEEVIYQLRNRRECGLNRKSCPPCPSHSVAEGAQDLHRPHPQLLHCKNRTVPYRSRLLVFVRFLSRARIITK